MVYQNQLEKIYCSYSRTEKIKNGFPLFYLLFLRSTLLLNRNKHIGNDLFVLYKFPLPSNVLLTPALRCSGAPDVD